MIRLGRYGVLNVVLHPHPPGAYRTLFEAAAKEALSVRYFGDRFARIAPISETRSGVFTGRLATWTEIDPESNIIEKKTLNEALLSDSDIFIPDNVGFNSRIFSFAFREADHRLMVELRNDQSEIISIGSAAKAFKRIFENAILDSDQEVGVFVVPLANSVDSVLKTPNLRRIEIQAELPNPDILSSKKQEIVDGLRAMKAQKIRVELEK